MNNLLDFILNQDEKIRIHLFNENDIYSSYYVSYVLLVINKKEIIIGKSFIIDFVETLQKKLKLAVLNELKLHSSIKKSIGYYWNQELNEEHPNIYLIQGKEYKYWVGRKYLLWTTDSNKKYECFATWLYNDVKGSIIFEVTPDYPEGFVDKDSATEVKAYQDWMEKSYKPFYTRIIPKEAAEQWLKQCKLLLKTIHNNTKMLDEQEAL